MGESAPAPMVGLVRWPWRFQARRAGPVFAGVLRHEDALSIRVGLVKIAASFLILIGTTT
jgi:hypothetical protein